MEEFITANNKTKYPWLNIIQFHKEIVQLEQDNFFQLRLDHDGCLDSTKCALLNTFSPDSLDDGWEISEGDFGSPAIIEDIKSGKTREGYIGGPCWVGYKSGKDAFNYLSPLLYQHVHVEWNDEEERIAIIPDEGRWELPPSLYDIIEKREFDSELPLEELPFVIIEQAHLLCEKGNKTLSEYLKQETLSKIPVISDLFSPRYPPAFYKSNPTPWVFFMAPSSSASMSRNLMPDYEKLERVIREDPSAIGGLRIFETVYEQHSGEDTESNVEPIIPLNKSQNTAVQGILDKKAIAVISGPPGCGKSQVVVSLLLNAWAQGKTVLFASNTKAAVDVVHERLKEFDCEYPITVLAGAKNRNTIESSFDKLKYLSITETMPQKEMRDIETQISALYAEQQKLQQFLNEKIPQRITQAKQTAWKSYLRHLEIKREIEIDSEPFRKEIAAMGYDTIRPESFKREVYLPLKRWLESTEQCTFQINTDEQQRREVIRNIEQNRNERDQILQNFGFQNVQASDCSWLTEGPGPEQFEQLLKLYQAVFRKDIEEYISSELRESHRRWTSESDAIAWIHHAENLKTTINQFLATYSDKLVSYQEVRRRYENGKTQLQQASLSETIPFKPSLLIDWKREYSHYLTLPDGILSVMKRKKSENQLGEIEKNLYQYFPDGIWSTFASNQKEGRKNLSVHIDLVLEWTRVLGEWESFGQDRTKIERLVREIEDGIRELKIGEIPSFNPTDACLTGIAGNLDKIMLLARESADAWHMHAKKERTTDEIRKISLQFEALIANTPVLEKWDTGNGYSFTQTIASLKSQPSLEQIVKARTFCDNSLFSLLLAEWEKALRLQRFITEYQSHRDSIPTQEMRITVWWSERPQNCSIKKQVHSALPDEENMLYRHLAECERISTMWEKYAEKRLSEKETSKREEFSRAIENLKTSYQNIPDFLRTESIDDVLLPLINQTMENSRWMESEDEQLFDGFNPVRIQAKINRTNTRLGELSLIHAKQNYLKRIEDGTYVLENLDELKSHLKRTYNKAGDFPEKKYLNALRAVPIWMTNAHQSQSLPMLPEIFDILIIDEASQCTLTNMLPMIYRAKSLAVIGDPDQLPAIIKIKSGKEQVIAKKHGMLDYLGAIGHSEGTMFNLGMRFLPGGRKNMFQLVEHYRSHPLIIGFSNLYIYQMRLSLRRDAIQTGKLTPSGVFGLNVSGECMKDKSWENRKEAEMVCSVIEDIRRNDEFMNKTIGVVTPFRGQKELIGRKLEEKGITEKEALVGTVDVFQGSERDIIIFSPVISKGMSPRTAEWSDDKNRINVALTRARDLLIVIGDFEYCRRMDTILGNLIEYVETVDTLRNTSMEELELFSLMLMEGGDLKINKANMPRIHPRIGAIEVDFILRNPEKGVEVVVEVDGKQHYHVEIKGDKFPVKYEGLHRFIELNGEKLYFHVVGNKEYVEIEGINHPVLQTTDSVIQDKIRDEFLRSEGYKVIRIHTKDIRDKPAVVAHDIKEILEIDE